MIKSPIKYFGGKGTMFKDILKYFPDFNSYRIYIEPYGGAASLLFAKEKSPIEIYNDLENNVYSLFKVISDKNLFNEFKHLCDNSFYSRVLRNEFKQRLKETNLSFVQRAFYFFYVNRTSHNGVGGFSVNTYIRRGMSKSTSDFLSAIDRLKDIHDRLSSVIIENCNGVSLLCRYDNSNTFAYLDPPYHHSTRTSTRYLQDMNNNEHKELINFLLGCKCKILLSGYINKEYKRLEDNNWNRIDFKVNTIDGNRNSKIKIESLWKNY